MGLMEDVEVLDLGVEVSVIGLFVFDIVMGRFIERFESVQIWPMFAGWGMD
jgi:hypothetical protein